MSCQSHGGGLVVSVLALNSNDLSSKTLKFANVYFYVENMIINNKKPVLAQ